MAIKKGDFVALDFIGKITDTGEIFDLTDKKVAEKEKIANKSADYSPRVVCIGNGDIVKGLDEHLVGKEIGKKYTLSLEKEFAFGKKDAKLIKMMPLKVFKDQNMNPFPGLQVNIDGMYGTIRTVSGGRVLVDFNHPLAGKGVTYEYTIKEVITDDSKKVSSVLKNLLSRDVECEVKDGKAIVDLDLPEEFTKMLTEKVTEVVKSVKEVVFKKSKEATTKQ